MSTFVPKLFYKITVHLQLKIGEFGKKGLKKNLNLVDLVN